VVASPGYVAELEKIIRITTWNTPALIIRVAVSTLPYDDLGSALMTVRDTILYLMDL